jgi:hypothetical protein
MELNTDKILQENLVQSPCHQTLGEEFNFQLDNNLKYKSKSTLLLLTTKTECSWVADLQFLLKSRPGYLIKTFYISSCHKVLIQKLSLKPQRASNADAMHGG